MRKKMRRRKGGRTRGCHALRRTGGWRKGRRNKRKRSRRSKRKRGGGKLSTSHSRGKTDASSLAVDDFYFF
jgi:hypothetical protein